MPMPLGHQANLYCSHSVMNIRHKASNNFRLFLLRLATHNSESVQIARIHSQFESLGFVGKYDQSPTNIVNSWTLKYEGADFLQNPRIFSLQNGPRMRANVSTSWISGRFSRNYLLLKGMVSRDFVVCFFGVIWSILSSYTKGAGSFAFKISFSFRIFWFFASWRSELTLWVELSY
jgi:hypothetical protein